MTDLFGSQPKASERDAHEWREVVAAIGQHLHDQLSPVREGYAKLPEGAVEDLRAAARHLNSFDQKMCKVARGRRGVGTKYRLQCVPAGGDGVDEPVCTHCGMPKAAGPCGLIWCPAGSSIEDDRIGHLARYLAQWFVREMFETRMPDFDPPWEFVEACVDVMAPPCLGASAAERQQVRDELTSYWPDYRATT